jgi:RNA polymerase sigma-70 factor, ECF subfamily
MMTYKKEDINQYRSLLFSIAYNMLGCLADAEDMVQETFASWISTDKSHVENPKFYLVRTVSNKCINHLKKLKQERELYTGTWLPEPIIHSDAEMDLANKNNLTVGFMFLLEKLSPIERGILILKESFGMEYWEISKIFNINYETSRHHLSRARKKLQLAKSRFIVDTNTHNQILNKFLDACLTGNFDQLIKLLREDVVMYAD